MLAALIAGGLLAAAPDAPAQGGPGLFTHLAGGRAPAHPFPPLALTGTTAPPVRTRPALLLLGGAAALAGLALTVPAVTHRGCAVSGQCSDGSQALVAGGLFLVGAALLTAADGSAPGTRGTVAVVSASQLRERLGLDIPLGAPGPRRTTLRWSPFRLQRGGGVRVGLAF